MTSWPHHRERPLPKRSRSRGSTGAPELVWSTDLGFAPDDLEVLGDRAVIFQATVGFVGIDLATGEVVWETEFGDTKWALPPAGRLEDPIRSSDDTVYFSLSSIGASGTDHGGIVGVTAAGEIALEIDTPWHTLVVRVDGDTMITMENPQTLSRYSAASGELVWTRDGVAGAESYETIGDTAVVSDGSVRQLLGLSVTTGDVLWSLEADQTRSWVSSEANRFYWWSEDREKNTLTAIDAASGNEQWTFAAPGLMRDEALTHNGIVYAALARDTQYGGPDATGTFAALDSETGAELWNLDFEFSFEAMSIHNDVLYISTRKPES